MENIVFSSTHAKALIDAENIDGIKAYIKLFFFRYQTNIFYFDGEIFNLMKQADALLLIPSDCKITRNVPNIHTQKFEKVEFTLKKFLKETEFMSIEYKPTIDFSKPRIFTKTRLMNGFEFTNHYINMSKPLNDNLTAIKPQITKQTQEGLKTVYNHIFEVLCSKNEILYEYVLNFFCASIGGRKVRKALIFQSADLNQYLSVRLVHQAQSHLRYLVVRGQLRDALPHRQRAFAQTPPEPHRVRSHLVLVDG